MLDFLRVLGQLITLGTRSGRSGPNSYQSPFLFPQVHSSPFNYADNFTYSRSLHLHLLLLSTQSLVVTLNLLLSTSDVFHISHHFEVTSAFQVHSLPSTEISNFLSSGNCFQEKIQTSKGKGSISCALHFLSTIHFSLDSSASFPRSTSSSDV
jgi:hypothetical protein